MPTSFIIKNGDDKKHCNFNRFHLAEVTGDPVKSMSELPNVPIYLTPAQAEVLTVKWAEISALMGFKYTYEVYDDVG